MSVASILSGTPAAIATGDAQNVTNATGLLSITQTSEDEGTGIVMNASGPDGIVLNTIAGNNITFNSDANIDLQTQNGNIDLSSAGGRVQLASVDVNLAGGNLNISSGAIGFFSEPAIAQQDGTIIANAAQVAGAGAPVLVDTLFGANGDPTKQYSVGQIVAALRAYGILK